MERPNQKHKGGSRDKNDPEITALSQKREGLSRNSKNDPEIQKAGSRNQKDSPETEKSLQKHEDESETKNTVHALFGAFLC